MASADGKESYGGCKEPLRLNDLMNMQIAIAAAGSYAVNLGARDRKLDVRPCRRSTTHSIPFEEEYFAVACSAASDRHFGTIYKRA